jgi:hypothetical protein
LLLQKGFESLGAHTNIYFFTDGSVIRYIWSHVKQPYGEPIPNQCSSCKAINSFATDKSLMSFEKFTLCCRGKACKKKISTNRPDGLVWVVDIFNQHSLPKITGEIVEEEISKRERGEWARVPINKL